MTQVIGPFINQYRFLGNFHKSPIRVQLNTLDTPPECMGVPAPVYEARTVEHAYQAARMLHSEQVLQVLAAPTPHAAKAMVRNMSDGLKIPQEAWDKVKVDVMRRLLWAKFSDKRLRRALLATGDAKLHHGNHHGDRFWGLVSGVGGNNLGKLLMEIRSQIRANMT